MNIPLNAASIGVMILLLVNLVTVVTGYTNLRRDAKSNKESTALVAATVLTLSNRYDTHVSNSGIHQESMSREAITLHMSLITAQLTNLTAEFKQHSIADMEIFKEIRTDLKTLTDRK